MAHPMLTSFNASSLPESAARYDAFISYSHAKDKPVASTLQGVMQKLGKPWYRRRALRIFRDDTSLAATPELWPTIEQALSQSRYLIVLASPQFAASKWCGMEVAYWCEHKSLDTILVALTESELAWDDAARDFRWNEATPLPAALMKKFRHEPKWIDLRSWREQPNATDPKFVDAATDFAAAVHGVPKEDLLSRELRQQKRALALGWSAAAVLLALTGAAGWQWWEADAAKRAAIASEQVAVEQRKVAEQQRSIAQIQSAAAEQAKKQAVAERDRAEKNLGLAQKAAEDLVFKIAQGMRNVEGMRLSTIRQILDTSQSVMEELVRSAPQDEGIQRSRAVMLMEFAITYLAAGNTDLARINSEQALTAFQQLATLNPSNSNSRREFAVMLNKAGDVRLAAGDVDGASAAFGQALAITRILLAVDPNSIGSQGDLTMSLDRLGEIRIIAGDRPGALDVYEENVGVLRKLASLEPDLLKWQEHLEVSVSKVGEQLMVLGKWTVALTAFEECLAISRRLVKQDDSNVKMRRSLAGSLFRIGQVYHELTQYGAALKAYRESFTIGRDLGKMDPDNAKWLRDLGVTAERMGETFVAMGDVPAARLSFEESVQIARRVVRLAPDYWQWRFDLAIGLIRLARTTAPNHTREILDEALAIAEELDRQGKLSGAERELPQVIRSVISEISGSALNAD
jgi:tetratricopeptide (TPR) repeat protein